MTQKKYFFATEMCIQVHANTLITHRSLPLLLIFQQSRGVGAWAMGVEVLFITGMASCSLNSETLKALASCRPGSMEMNQPLLPPASIF